MLFDVNTYKLIIYYTQEYTDSKEEGGMYFVNVQVITMCR